MYEKNLSLILQQYIDRFEELNNPDGDDEGYKWRAVSCFKKHWDIDAVDFPAMFKNAFKDSSNLIDNKMVQPLGGILMLLNHSEEIEFVREAFRNLFSEDYGDIDARQNRVYDFIEKINTHIEKYVSGSWKYPQKINNAIYYLNMWRPEENYIFKSKEATDWANCIEFSDDFGEGETFCLKKYYQMCDELLEVVSKDEIILKLHKARFEKEAKGFDDQMHILVYDIIYCSSYHNFYSKAVAATTSTKKRIENAKLRAEYEQEKQNLDRLIQQKAIITNEMKEPIDLTGSEVSHKLWKTGTVRSFYENTLEVEFTVGVKTFLYPDIFVGGFLIAKDNDTMAAIEKEHQKLLVLNKLEKEILNAEKRCACLQEKVLLIDGE